MIFTDRKITIRNGKSSINEPVILYRGDYEVSIKFTIMESKFRFQNGVNLVDSEKASHGQLAILTPYGGNVFSEIVKCEDGTVTFTLTKEMIDQLEEVGLYSFQIRLFDYYRESRVSIPPVEFGIEVREPIASEDHDNEVNNAIVGYSIAKVVDPSKENVGDTFDDNGNYNKTDWETGDRISEGKLNKIEDAIDKINQNEINDTNALNKQMTSNFNVLTSQLTNIENDKADKTSYIDSTRDLEKLYNALGENNNNRILVKKVNSDRYNIYIHHYGDQYQQHRFTRESTYFDSKVSKHANGDVFASELANLIKLKVQKNSTLDGVKKSGTWTSSVASSVYSKTANDYIEFTFYGTECRLDLYKASNAGICRVQIDGEDSLCNTIPLTDGQCLIDTYGSGSSYQGIIATNLPEEYHTVRITVTGEKNNSSSEARIYFQNIRYWQSLFSEPFATSQIIENDNDAVAIIPSIVKELAISVDGVYRGFYHRYCYPIQSLETYIDGKLKEVNIGEFIVCNNIQFKQTARLYAGNSDFGELVTISNYNSNGIMIKNKFTALRDFISGPFYPAMSGFYCQKVITSNCGGRELLKNEAETNMSNDTSSVLSINKAYNYIGYTKFLYCSEGVIDNPYTPHFFNDRQQGYAKIYFVNNKRSFEKGYSYESIVRHSIKKCFSANML